MCEAKSLATGADTSIRYLITYSGAMLNLIPQNLGHVRDVGLQNRGKEACIGMGWSAN